MEIYDYIEFNVFGKIRKIELCLGDITKLSIKDSVDLLLLSAFPGDYTPVKGSLIGALHNKLNLSVKALAKDKSEELRTHFNCWISKELPSHLPFKKILCLEQNDKNFLREDPTNLVGAMFRALFTTFNNNEWSMITPILGTGSQMSNKTKMLNEMVRACSAWISAKMPLSCMKIVIYKGENTKYLNQDDKDAIEEFSRLKSEINWKPFINFTSIRYDALFLFVKEDEDAVNIFFDILCGHFNEIAFNIKLKCLNRKYNGIYSINYDIYEKFQRKMLESRKVGLFLSNDFLECPKAIEAYNLALCLTQKTKKSLLTPVCLKRLNELPEYMSLNQWIDCRIKEGKSSLEDQLREGAKSFFQVLADTVKLSVDNNTAAKSPDSNVSSIQQEFINFNYDVFISYSHKDDTKCKKILDFLESSLPNIRIFYDKNDIKTGFSWQEIIYNSLNGSKIVLALLSENYIQSSMCQEEFSIAISQDWSSEFETKLFPIWISDKSVQSIISDYPGRFSKSFLMNSVFVPNYFEITSDQLSSDMHMISLFHFILSNIIQPSLLEKDIRTYRSNFLTTDLTASAVKARSNFFYKTWNLKESFNFTPLKEDEELLDLKSTTNKTNDIVIGFHVDDSVYANYLYVTILKINKDLRIVFCPMGHKSDEWKSLKDIESAYAIVILLKPYYVTTKSCRDQLHIALSLQRKYGDSGPIVIPIILETLPQKPSYFHLLQSRFKADDEIYLTHAKNIDYSRISQDIIKCDYDVKVSKRIAIMLTFASHWIAERIFVKSLFNPPKSSIIYSTFDLINTSFNVPQCADSAVAEKQIKILDISKMEIDLAKIYLSGYSKDFIDKDIQSRCEDTQQIKRGTKSELSHMKSLSITRICLIM